ncbi:MAG: hypothetical protein FWH27_13010 [Planctomycetaceae bacterium]|nr:hypothetical protein [Planctomycetaceae bacterium]
MPEHDINSSDPLEMVRAIREKIYEETKHMTIDERMEYTERSAAECRRIMQEINPDDFDLPFRRKRVEKQETEHAESH